MGFLKFLSGGGSGLIGGVLNAASSIFNGERNRKMQQEENEKDRQFNAEQAEISRNWQEQMYDTRESPQAQAQARKAAGLNPTEGVGSQSVGSSSTASASSSALPVAQPPSFEFISQLPLLSEQIKQAKSESAIKASEAEGQATLRAKERAELQGQLLANAREAFLNGTLEEWNNAQLSQIYADRDNKVISSQEAKARIANLEFVNRQAQAFEDAGGNTFMDESKLKESLASMHNSQAEYNRGLLSIENYLKDFKANNLQAGSDHYNQSVENLKAEHTNLQEQATKLSQENAIREITKTLSNFYGFDVSHLPPTLLYEAAEYYGDFIQQINRSEKYGIPLSDPSYKQQQAFSRLSGSIEQYRSKETHIVQSKTNAGSAGLNLGLLWGLLDIGANASAEISRTK